MKSDKAAPASALYGLGFIGSVVYFLFNANGFLDGLLGVPKSIVWPAIRAYE